MRSCRKLSVTQVLGYKTLVDFKEGLRRTVEWYRHEFHAEAGGNRQRA